jgi:hypothetical protein
VKARAAAWEQLGDKYVASIARHGLALDWIEGFNPYFPEDNFRPAWWTSKVDELPKIFSIIEQWLADGIVKEVPPTHPMACASVFTVPKRGTDELRLITNLRNVNAFLQTTHFSLPTFVPLLQKGMWATSVDIKSAYHHWPIIDLTSILRWVVDFLSINPCLLAFRLHHENGNGRCKPS